jgi:Carboxylesterase family
MLLTTQLLLRINYICSSCMSTTRSGSSSTGSTDPVMSSMGVATGPQSEDCLYINVWSKPQTGEKKKAVMVNHLCENQLSNKA